MWHANYLSASCNGGPSLYLDMVWQPESLGNLVVAFSCPSVPDYHLSPALNKSVHLC
jgi:hypothetical protein